ncbi:hypothetical protein B0T11DRAFT_19857 [Plectosphaerella cucumerina]|uniref:Uncharacterized protein n=1 Tax=Plectosphaerella cucumerina TaxID=40658 RepID=A0A8K0TQ28_9PEZI|nr:hypothetical protein B0T11DRAFT_19857 [Plectosphaerella cucumerina]
MGLVPVSERQYGFVGIPTGQGISYRAETERHVVCEHTTGWKSRRHCDGGDPGVVPPGWNLMTMTGWLYRYVRPGNQPSLSDLFSRLVAHFVVRAVMLSSWCLVEVEYWGGSNNAGKEPPKSSFRARPLAPSPSPRASFFSPTSPQNIRYSLLSSTSAKRSHFLLYAAYDSGRSHSNTITIAHSPGITRIPHFLSCAARTVGVLDAPLTFGAEGATSRPAPYSQVSLRRVPKAARCSLAQLARDRHPSTHRRDRRAPARLRRSSWRSWPIPHFPAVVYQHG